MAKKVTKKTNPKWVAKKYGFKSGLEETISQQIESKGIVVEYETEKVPYIIPATISLVVSAITSSITNPAIDNIAPIPCETALAINSPSDVFFMSMHLHFVITLSHVIIYQILLYLSR